MSCNCKTAKKVEKLLPNANGKEKKSLGVYKILDWVGNSLWNLFKTLCVAILIGVMCPIVFIILIYNLIFRGGMFLEIPNFLNKKIGKSNKELEEEKVALNGAELSN